MRCIGNSSFFIHNSSLGCYLIFNVIIVIAASTMVTIQKRTVIFDSWNNCAGWVNTTLQPGSIRFMPVRKWSCIGVRTYTQPRCAFNNPKPLTFIGQHRFQPPVHSGKCSQEILLHGRIAVIIVPARCQQTRQQDDKQTTAMFFHTYLPRKLLQFHSDARKKHHLVAAR